MNILVFSYYLYPGNAVGGMRAHMLADGLVARGHIVQVVTAEQAVAGDQRYRRWIVSDSSTVTRWDKLLQVPDVRRRWIEDALSSALTQGMFDWADVLITSGGPFSTHLAGLHARDMGWSGTWVAEYRDLWSGSPYYAYGPVRRAIDRKIERRVLVAADVVVAATELMAHQIREARPNGVAAVYSAVMAPPDALSAHELGEAEPDRCLRIAHAGYLYKGRRDVRPLLRAVAAMKRSTGVGTGDLEVHFFGPRDRNLSDSVERLSLQDCVTVHGEVPRDQLWRELARMNVLTVIRWQSPGDAPFIPGKLYEYIAFGVPVLLVNAVAGGEAEGLVSELGCGSVCATESQIEEALSDLVQEKRRVGHLRCRCTGGHGRFSQEHFIDAYEAIILGAVSSKATRC